MCVLKDLHDAGDLDVKELQHTLVADGACLHVPGENGRSMQSVDQNVIC